LGATIGAEGRLAPNAAPSCPRMQTNVLAPLRTLNQQKTPQLRGVMYFFGLPETTIWWTVQGLNL
jgi:hypothetical protein